MMNKRLWTSALLLLLVVGFCVIPVHGVDTVTGATHRISYEAGDISQAELDLMQSYGPYIVAYETESPPLSYLDEDGNLVGTAVDAVRTIGENLGIELTFIPMKSDAIYDIALVNRSVSLGDEVQQGVPYYTSSYVILESTTRSIDWDDPVGVLTYFRLTEEQITAMLGDNPVTAYSNFDSMNQAFMAGDIQGMVLTSVRYNCVKNQIDIDDYTVDILPDVFDNSLYYSDRLLQEQIDIFNVATWNLDQDVLNYSILYYSTYASTMNDHWFVDLVEDHPVSVACMVFAPVLLAVLLFAWRERRRREQIVRTMEVDALTGLSTRYYFEKELAKVLAEIPCKQYTMFAFDVDNFKYINEIYGYSVGTEVICSLADRLRMDESTTVVTAHCEADEFLVLVETAKLDPRLVDQQQARQVTQFVDLTYLLGEDYQFSLSLGYYHIPTPTPAINYMIDCAKLARNLGKHTVGFTVNQFTPEMEQTRSANNQVVATMEAGIKNREFVVYYQPKIDLSTGAIIGVEALVRWQRNNVLVPPGQFIPIFEKNGFIETVDYYVLDKVCQFIKAHDHVPVVSVNLSGVTVEKPDLVERLLQLVASYGVRPERVDLEITESALVDHFQEAVAKLHALRQAGFSVAMDDFGVGISSLGRLRNIPLDVLKIDRAFIMDAVEKDRGGAIVKCIVEMAKQLDLKTVAEGIETQEQLRFLKDLGCDQGQGFIFSRPVAEDVFLELLEKKFPL